LKAVVEAIEKGDAEAALRLLAPLKLQPNPIPDYLAFWEAQAHALRNNHASVVSATQAVWTPGIESPVQARAALLAADALLEQGLANQVLPLLARVPQERMQQPGSFAAMAKAQEQNRDLVGAADFWQRVYLGYPLTPQAAQAASALERLETALGSQFRPAAPSARLERAARFVSARQYTEARREYLKLAPQLEGLEREQARVRAAATLYQARKAAEAARELDALECRFEEADAERLYWLVLTWRRLDRRSDMHDALNALQKRAPLSPWRQKALVQAANEYLVGNEHQEFVPLYQACADDFADRDDAALCHWRVTWRAYLEHRPDATQKLRDHLERYPSSEKAGAALYYLGRSAERAQDLSAAHRFWREAFLRFPNSYYGVLSRDLTSGAPATPAPETDQFLRAIRWPQRELAPDFRPAGVNQRRVQRARFLAASGLETWAEGELRFGVRTGANPWPLALELARTATRRGAPPVALRHIKGTVPGYLYLPRDAAPAEFWKYAFPFPYRYRIDRHARERGLDPYLVAALIRQESEFDPSAVSVAKAVGLMQVMPGTGRELSRKLGIRPFRTALLKDPETNIRLGTYYLSRQIESRQGSVEDTLAGYNAGPSRVPKWRGWNDYREPAEFVETIPFQQTRDYVQIIERNADVYRWLYSSEPMVYEPEPPPPAAPPKASAAKSTAAKSTSAKPTAKPKSSATKKAKKK
jgi:soluble lytic murein transglycosylase